MQTAIATTQPVDLQEQLVTETRYKKHVFTLKKRQNEHTMNAQVAIYAYLLFDCNAHSTPRADLIKIAPGNYRVDYPSVASAPMDCDRRVHVERHLVTGVGHALPYDSNTPIIIHAHPALRVTMAYRVKKILGDHLEDWQPNESQYLFTAARREDENDWEVHVSAQLNAGYFAEHNLSIAGTLNKQSEGHYTLLLNAFNLGAPSPNQGADIWKTSASVSFDNHTLAYDSTTPIVIKAQRGVKVFFEARPKKNDARNDSTT